MCEEAWAEALEGLRVTLRGRVLAEVQPNPFARPLPCPIENAGRTAKILRIF
ncbi:hypothetical protein [Parvularcula lutaonensis]|uniref:Uncharacterized protein n=1 Tax=Parvularcula lutaonensis TaxID=491923 RepID=A0ABV7MCM6_9PROT|nr:hypothetical protein [Parvularcula lutaonensis]